MARSVLVYGESGTYKTTNLGEMADEIFSHTGGITRLLTADSSFGPMNDQVRRGIVEPLDLTTVDNPLPVLRKVSQGYWPTKWFKKGTPNVVDGGLAMTSPMMWPKIGAYAVEGLSMIASCLMLDLISKGRDTGEPLTSKFLEDGVQFADSSRGTYKFVQTQTYDYVMAFRSLPCPWVIFSAHEGKGEDNSKRLVFGPAIAGKSGTDKISGWFENTIHMESYNFEYKLADGSKVIRPGVRGFFIRHPDPDVGNIFWPAKLGVEPRIMAQMLNTWKEGSIPMIMNEQGQYLSGVSNFLRMLYKEEGTCECEICKPKTAA